MIPCARSDCRVGFFVVCTMLAGCSSGDGGSQAFGGSADGPAGGVFGSGTGHAGRGSTVDSLPGTLLLGGTAATGGKGSANGTSAFGGNGNSGLGNSPAGGAGGLSEGAGIGGTAAPGDAMTVGGGNVAGAPTTGGTGIAMPTGGRASAGGISTASGGLVIPTGGKANVGGSSTGGTSAVVLTGGRASTGGVSAGGATSSSTATVPQAPSGLAISNVSDSSVKLTWQDNSSNETGFEIGRCTGTAVAASNGSRQCSSGFALPATAAANTTSFAVSGLRASTSYDLYVRAYNSAGTSEAPLISVTTAAPPSACGTCPSNSTCNQSSATCVCNSGYVPNPEFTKCIALSGSCSGTGVDQIGYCADSSTWVWCDPKHGISWMDCPSAVGENCYRANSTGTAGACGCGAIDSTNGTCSSWGSGGPENELHFFCSLSGVLAVSNCRAQTGRASGQCSTLVTAFGYQTACSCGGCSLFDYSSSSCYSAGSGCQYSSSSNACICG